MEGAEMMSYEEIEARREELEAMAKETGYTKEINAGFEALYDAEMERRTLDADAIARSENVIIFVEFMCECGYAVNTKINGEWDYHDCFTAVGAMERFAELAREHGIKKVLVRTEYLDRKALEEEDRKRAEYEREREYEEACMASAYGNDSLLNRYNRKYGIEKEYGPANPWDAPGMSVNDFI